MGALIYLSERLIMNSKKKINYLAFLRDLVNAVLSLRTSLFNPVTSNSRKKKPPMTLRAPAQAALRGTKESDVNLFFSCPWRTSRQGWFEGDVDEPTAADEVGRGGRDERAIDVKKHEKKNINKRREEHKKKMKEVRINTNYPVFPLFPTPLLFNTSNDKHRPSHSMHFHQYVLLVLQTGSMRAGSPGFEAIYETYLTTGLGKRPESIRERGGALVRVWFVTYTV